MTAFKIEGLCYNNGTVAEWVRTSGLSHCEWMVTSSNPGEDKNHFYSPVVDGGLSVTLIDGYFVVIIVGLI